MDMVSFLAGFIVACVFWLIVAVAYNAGKQQSRVEKKKSEHEEQMERVQSKLK